VKTNQMSKVRAVFLLAAAALPLGGCATQESLVPQDYHGPTALISDSTYVYSSRRADFFYVEAIDGRPVDNALERTARDNRGHGLAFTPEGKDRPVEVKQTVFHIAGRTHYAAPILEMTGTAYLVDGDVNFSPVAGEAYVIKGSLGPDYSAVWIENKNTGAQMGNKLLIKGAAEVSMVKKRPPVEQVPPP
jgi:hypothetical protein